MELIDTHSHLTFKELACDIEAVLSRSRDASVNSWITVGTDAGENRKSIELANKHKNMYASIGFHPHYAQQVTEDNLIEISELAKNDCVVAIGETGLDFHYNFSKQPIQETIFEKQLEIAAKLKLPVIVHSREAFDRTFEILTSFGSDLEKVVFHCFSGSAQEAEKILAQGFYLSFTGVVTFKNADSVRSAARIAPLNRMMLETDCPYMSPEPMRKQTINEPALMVHTAKFLAQLKQVEFEEFCKAVTAASRDFFGLKS